MAGFFENFLAGESDRLGWGRSEQKPGSKAMPGIADPTAPGSRNPGIKRCLASWPTELPSEGRHRG
eukprot:8073185-Prorocentrum_lima.AAC.1